MAIVIPSKSIYTPIENEKVRTPTKSISFSELYTNSQNINIKKTFSISGSSGTEEDVLLPISEYYQSTLKPIGDWSMRVELHIGEDGEENPKTYVRQFNSSLSFNTQSSHEGWIVFEKDDQPTVGFKFSITEKIVVDENGVSCKISFYTFKVDYDETVSSKKIQLDTIQISFAVSAVKRDFQEQTIKFGNDSKDVFSIPSNELIQSSATVYKGLSGIRYYGIERGSYIDEDLNEGKRYTYNVLQGNEVSSLLPITDETNRYVGWYHSDGKTIVNVYNLSENTEINKHNADFIRDVGFYWGTDYDEIPCTYSFMEDLLSVYIDSEVDLSLGFRVVLDFGEGGWRKTENLSSVIAKGVLEQYGKGKETARIRCSTNDYYDENDDLAISPTGKNDLPMLFSINDEVIPMVTPERAMSYYKDETRKVFRVVGVRFENRGALWQELTLQEK